MKKILSIVVLLVCTISSWAVNPNVNDSPVTEQSRPAFDYDLELVPWMTGKWSLKGELGLEYYTFNSDGTFKMTCTIAKKDAQNDLSITLSIGGDYGWSPDYSAIVLVYDIEQYNGKINRIKGFEREEAEEFIDDFGDAFEENEKFMLYPMNHNQSRMTFRDVEGAVATFNRVASK